MNFKIILQLLLFIIFIGCKQLETTQKKTIKTEPDTSTAETTLKSSDEDEEDSSKYIFDREYTNQGFALIYDENLFNKKSISKKLDNRALFIFHTKIRKNSFVKITNPENTKTVIAQVISNKAIFSNFYNSVITKRIVDELLLDENEPYVELSLISNESTFVAKKAKTFDEEKKVAQKAPVDGITIDNLGTVEKKELPKTSQSNFLYSIKIADFYYKDSAENMIQRIKDETKITNPVIKKLSQTKYRVLLGPFNDIKKIQESFDEIEKLNFENLKIIKDV
ncbi:SPOR domain-containing protein [Candidatus Pelagibacter sp. HIMB1542]|uniref:SPOR domain-containing protein n=1 Tax=Candidatus Pelagibacter sp. HIMB1542 TaxID=3413346 RepID=UPI003F874172